MGRVLTLVLQTTFLALGAVERHKISFRDALIWATAKLHSIDVIYSEDLPSGRIIEGVKYINAFEEFPNN